ncbi:MAG: VOC family protein [Pseudomonadota bacterium]
MSDPAVAPLGRLVIYTKKIDEMADFYARHFGYEVRRAPGDRIVELAPTGTGAAIMLHPATAKQKEGQALVKLVFDVEDVAGFCALAAEKGLVFGKTHQANGYAFANTKDPGGNSIQVSSRAYRT